MHLTVKKAYDNLEAEGIDSHSSWERNVCSGYEYTADGRKSSRKEVEADLEAAIQKGKALRNEGGRDPFVV